MSERSGACATVARVLGEPLPGTAPLATGWLLVEDLGPWGHDALADGTLPEAVVEHIRAETKGRPIRYQAIRRPDRQREALRRVFYVHAGPTPWTRMLELPVEDLVELDPAATLAAEPPTAGVPHDDGIVLVCTHGKRDPCCAERGRPTAVVLATRFPDVVWETSHTGGHRFAPNVIVLPEGVVYGFQDGGDAVAAIDARQRGELDLAHLRGRSAWPRPAQAAEVTVRRQRGLTRLTDVTLVSADVDDDHAAVVLEVAGRPVTVTLDHRSIPVRPLSCGADPEDPGTWVVTDVRAG